MRRPTGPSASWRRRWGGWAGRRPGQQRGDHPAGRARGHRSAYRGRPEEQIAAAGAGLTGRIPLGRIARPAEIAWWIVNVARPEAAYLTGAVIRVDGGLSVAAGQQA
ncbi:SDR family oxidoreductase [Nonomuraea salmonea]|uniref:SDR family oxidoreductase n=1 Tax=Nonomuraea salmonea TaxID=46181 RepID=UPI0031E89B3F